MAVFFEFYSPWVPFRLINYLPGNSKFISHYDNPSLRGNAVTEISLHVVVSNSVFRNDTAFSTSSRRSVVVFYTIDLDRIATWANPDFRHSLDCW